MAYFGTGTPKHEESDERLPSYLRSPGFGAWVEGRGPSSRTLSGRRLTVGVRGRPPGPSKGDAMGGITPAELAAIGDRLEGFAADVFESLPRRDQRGRGECYLRGLLLDGRRSVGVQRQYCGTLGKRANCQLGVSVNAITEHASCPLDWRLFVPESWDEEVMAARRAACHLPEGVRHRPKWQLVLDLLDELAGWGLVPPVLVADCGYGEVGEFRWGLEGRQIDYVVEVRSDTSAYPEQARPTAAPSKGRGRRPRPRYHHQPASLAELAMAAGQQAWVELVWRRGSRGLQRG